MHLYNKGTIMKDVIGKKTIRLEGAIDNNLVKTDMVIH